MFSLLVGLDDGTIPRDRLFEYTDEGVRATFGSDIAAGLQALPALSMPEIGDDRFEQVATIGTITDFRVAGKGYRFTFQPDTNFDPIPSSTVLEIADRLHIDADRWEFTRTHWAVKSPDLFKVLLERQNQMRRGGPRDYRPTGAVQFPVEEPRDPSLVAVMMPFAPAFDIIYETIEAAAEDVDLRCSRADDIWEHDHVMGDVLSLIWRARIVVADLTDKNSNVFYETGLAQALPRDTVLLTQTRDDVPFDLQAIRYLEYGVGTMERERLRTRLADRFATLLNLDRG